jgi:hypothetical protein
MNDKAGPRAKPLHIGVEIFCPGTRQNPQPKTVGDFIYQNVHVTLPFFKESAHEHFTQKP